MKPLHPDLRAWLLDGGPRPADADALLAADPEAAALAADLEAVDEAVAALPVLAAPPALAARALSAVLAEMERPAVAPPPAEFHGEEGPEIANTPGPVPRWLLVPGGLMSLAAAALLAVGLSWGPTPHTDGPIGDPTGFVPRGGPSLGHVGLRVAVQRDGKISRLDGAPRPGDDLLFRYEVDRAGELRILRFAGGAVTEVGRTGVGPGAADFPSSAGLAGSAPDARSLLAWHADPGDPAAVFALVRCEADPADVRPVADTADAVCAALRDAGCACDAVAVGATLDGEANP